MIAVQRQVKEAEHFRSGSKSYGPALLLQRERGYPDRNEPVLTEWNSEIRMGNEMEKEFAVAAAMNKLGRWWAAERQATQDEWPGMESDLLTAAFSLFSDKADRFELLEFPFRDAEVRKNFSHLCEGGFRRSWQTGLDRRGSAHRSICFAVEIVHARQRKFDSEDDRTKNVLKIDQTEGKGLTF